MRRAFSRRFFIIGALTLGWGAADSLAQNYPTPGFDCASATTAQELRICRSPQLGELDGRHWYLAERAIKGARDSEATRAGVESWINQVRNGCETDKCLADAYTARNAVLERDVAALAPVRPPPMPAGMPAPAPPAIDETKRAIENLPSPPAAPTPPPAPSAAAAPKPAVVLAPRAETEDGTQTWPWILGAALIAALGLRYLLSGRGVATGKARRGDRG